MNTSQVIARVRQTALVVLGCAFPLVALPLSASAAGQPVLADNNATLPLKATFEKDTSGKNEAPIVLHLMNESKHDLTVTTHIDLSVVVHNRPKTRELPAQKIAAGGTMTIDNLAPEDKVTLTAEGHAPLVIEVPYQK